MMPPAKKATGNPDALRKSRQADSEMKKAAVAEAVQELLSEGTVVSVAETAKRAGVSRPFIYSHPDLQLVVETAMRTQRESNVKGQKAPTRSPAAMASMKSDLAVAQQEIKRLRDENTRLRADLRLDLGAQLEAADRETAASLLADKTREVERLVSELHQVRRQLRALERERDELAEDLAAERRATIALADEGNVTPLHRHDRPDT